MFRDACVVLALKVFRVFGVFLSRWFPVFLGDISVSLSCASGSQTLWTQSGQPTMQTPFVQQMPQKTTHMQFQKHACKRNQSFLTVIHEEPKQRFNRVRNIV